MFSASVGSFAQGQSLLFTMTGTTIVVKSCEESIIRLIWGGPFWLMLCLRGLGGQWC